MRINAIKINEKPIDKPIISCGNKPDKPVKTLLHGSKPKSSLDYFA